AAGEDSSTTGVNSTPNESATGAGAAYVFARSGATWSQQAYLKPAAVGTTQAGDNFGYSVAVSGDTVAVGAPYEASSTTGVNSTPNENAAFAGAAYVFVRSGATWNQQAYLKPAAVGTTQDHDNLGYSVAASGDTVVVGAYQEDSSTTGVNSTPNESARPSGAAYVFVRSGTTWCQQAYLKASNTQASDYFGGSVAVSGDTVVVGAYAEDSSMTGVNSTPDENAANSGAAYVFTGLGLPEIAVEQPSGTDIPDGSSKSFGTANVGSSADLTFTIKNTGSANLTGLGITIDGTDAGQFSVTALPTAPVSGPSGSTTFTVRFTPGTLGAKTAALHIANNDSDENPFDITLSGTGVAQEIAVQQPVGTDLADGSASIDFGTGLVGTASPVKTFNIINSGDANLTGLAVTQDGAQAADFTVDTTGMSTTLAPSASTTFTVTFTPGAAGARNAALHIASNDADESPFDVGLTGEGVTPIQIAQRAYLKASNTGASDYFGYSVAMDGNTVVVGAYGEGSSATGVNGDQSDDSASVAGAAYVFVRSGTTWSQQAYLKASNTGAQDYFGSSVAVSGDTVVVGAYGEDSSATGVNGDQSDNTASYTGAAYVFVRSGTTWSEHAYLKASNTGVNDAFGYSVGVSGDTVVAGAYRESSSATGVNGNQSDDGAVRSGAVYFFTAFNWWYEQLFSFNGTSDGRRPYPKLTEGSDGALYSTARYGGANNKGVVFKINKNGTGFTVLHAFAGTDGNEPAYGVIEGSDGALYGATSAGGSADVGTVFKLGKDGNEFSVLHHFSTSGGDGQKPFCRLVEGADGALYGTTELGGSAGHGTVFKLNKAGGAYATLHSFTGTPTDGSASVTGLMLGRDAVLYGPTLDGGTANQGALFRLNQDGTDYTVFHSFANASGEGLNPRRPLTEGSDGALYGTASDGGGGSGGTVFRINKDGSGFTLLHSFTGTGGDGKNPTSDVVEAPDGALYGLTDQGGSAGVGTIFKVNKDGSGYRVVRSFLTSGDDGQQTGYGLTLASDGALYGTSYLGGSAGSGTIFRLVPNTAPIATADYGATRQNTALTISAVKLACTDADAEGQALTVTGVSATSAQGGTVTLVSGIVTYTPPSPGFVGSDSFAYTVSDGHGGTATGTVTVSVTSASGQSSNLKIWASSGHCRIRIAGLSGYKYRLERSNDLQTWEVVLTTFTMPASGVREYEEDPPGGSAYYRTVWVP
ncbi:MAG: choice-of-anchor D domain-containing protein, partial [Verrucomicrobia bacterium]|nr:choice-of-anchor D domain-containing protein [Verrucomicrobiota bacterium]